MSNGYLWVIIPKNLYLCEKVNGLDVAVFLCFLYLYVSQSPCSICTCQELKEVHQALRRHCQGSPPGIDGPQGNGGTLFFSGQGKKKSPDLGRSTHSHQELDSICQSKAYGDFGIGVCQQCFCGLRRPRNAHSKAPWRRNFESQLGSLDETKLRGFRCHKAESDSHRVSLGAKRDCPNWTPREHNNKYYGSTRTLGVHPIVAKRRFTLPETNSTST